MKEAGLSCGFAAAHARASATRLRRLRSAETSTIDSGSMRAGFPAARLLVSLHVPSLIGGGAPPRTSAACAAVHTPRVLCSALAMPRQLEARERRSAADSKPCWAADTHTAAGTSSTLVLPSADTLAMPQDTGEVTYY